MLTIFPTWKIFSDTIFLIAFFRIRKFSRTPVFFLFFQFWKFFWYSFFMLTIFPIWKFFSDIRILKLTFQLRKFSLPQFFILFFQHGKFFLALHSFSCVQTSVMQHAMQCFARMDPEQLKETRLSKIVALVRGLDS